MAKRVLKSGKAAYMNVYITADLKERLEKLARFEELSVSRLVGKLLRDSVEQEELVVKAMSDPVLGPAMASAFARPEVLRALGSVLREDLSDDQLRLFSAVTHGVVAAAAANPPAVSGTPPPARKKKGKR
jgi:hypothetical protein